MSDRPRVSRLDLAAGLLIVVVVTTLWLRLGPTVDGAGWIGWDAYPILLASHVDSVRDVADVATRRLAGEYLKADFYRPLFMLSVSAEQALLDASPRTSLAIQIALFGACLGVLWWWLRSLPVATGSGGPGGLLTLGLVAMHPAVLDVVPYLPRRADLLCLLFVLLTLRLDRLWITSGHSSLTGMVPTTSLLCAALAMASKETALLLPILVVASRWLAARMPTPSLTMSMKASLQRLAHYGAAVGVVLLPRLAVLGGAGGYPDAERSIPFSPKLVVVTGLHLLAPESGLVNRTSGFVAIFLLGLGFLLALLQAGGTDRDPMRQSMGDSAPDLAKCFRVVWFSVLWTFLAGLLFAIVGRVSPWYMLFVACGAFLGAGCLTVFAWYDLRRRWTWKHWGNLWLAGAALLLVTWWPGSLFGGSTAELRDAGQAAATCLERTAQRCDQVSSGERVPVRGCRSLVAGHGRSIAVTKPRSVAAWAAWSRRDCLIHWTPSRAQDPTDSTANP